PASLRLVVTGSEPVQSAASRLWQDLAPHCRLLSAYGLTETTISVAFFEPGARPANEASLPLGEPIRNVELSIVDEDDKALPPLCVGEIQVHGAALMLAAPADDKAGTGAPLASLRTGDLGRMDLDGR